MQGEGDIYISYRDWHINTGLDDSLFQSIMKSTSSTH